uniref:Uncharacterized protein n=1 Tax=viral metagenome TaxID=1070528 RepID=A0A6C0DSA8_9ZZZZ
MSYENQNHFLSDNNVKMLWEIILDDDIVVNKNRDEITQINRIFLSVAQQFYDKEKNLHQTLIGMNKKFISVIVNILNQNFPKPKPLVIHEKETIPITAEEIQKSRENEFEQEFKRKQNEFTRAMSLPVPETPKFSDNARDEPISELDVIIKRTIAERNLEMQQITNNFNKSEVENWIKSSETSVRVEKLRENENATKKIKLGNLMDYDVPSDENIKQKNVSWADDLTENNILPGLKLKITEIEPKEINNTTSIDEKIDKLEKKVDVIFSMIEKLLLEKNKN